MNDVREGSGRMDWADGSWYEGEFRNGRMNGHGIFCDSEGRTYEGTFEDDKPVRSVDRDPDDTGDAR